MLISSCFILWFDSLFFLSKSNFLRLTGRGVSGGECSVREVRK